MFSFAVTVLTNCGGKFFENIANDDSKKRAIDDILRFIYDNADNRRETGDGIYYIAQNGRDEYASAFKTIFVAMGQAPARWV